MSYSCGIDLVELNFKCEAEVQNLLVKKFISNMGSCKWHPGILYVNTPSVYVDISGRGLACASLVTLHLSQFVHQITRVFCFAQL